MSIDNTTTTTPISIGTDLTGPSNAECGVTLKPEFTKQVKPWEPTTLQKLFANLIMNWDDPRSYKEKADDIGISQTTYCNWLRDERFVNYLNSTLPTITDAQKARVMSKIMQRIDIGDMRAVTLFAKISGMDTREQKPGDITNNTLIITDAQALSKATELNIQLPESVRQRLKGEKIIDAECTTRSV